MKNVFVQIYVVLGACGHANHFNYWLISISHSRIEPSASPYLRILKKKSLVTDDYFC